MSSEPAAAFTATGGARAGFVNWSWPCGRLEVTASSLRLTITFFRRWAEYTFRPEEIISITRHGGIPFFRSGVRINHSRSDYPAQIIFWCLGSPDTILAKIAATGFHGAAAPEGHAPSQRPSGFPLHPRFWFSWLIAWNGLTAIDVWRKGYFKPALGPGCVAALALTVVCCIAVLKFPAVQRFALKPGFQPADARPLLILIGSIAALMLPVIAVFVWLAGR